MTMTETGENQNEEFLDETAEQRDYEIATTDKTGEKDTAKTAEQRDYEIATTDKMGENDTAKQEEIIEAKEMAAAGDEPEATTEEAKSARVWERWLLFLIAGGIIFLDQYSKSLVESALELYTYWAPFPELENLFRITHITNTGVAFGLFQNGNTIFTILAIVVSIAIIVYNSRLEGGHKLLRLALGLQMGGALGNMIDRVRQGHVTDFMDFGPWPVWNVADLAIVSGTILLVLIMFYEERQEKKLAEEAAVNNDQVEPSLETTTPHIDESPTS